MSTHYEQGEYFGRITQQAVGKTKTGKPQFVVSFVVLGQVDPDDPEGYIEGQNQYERSMFRVITDKTVPYVIEDLDRLGIIINSWGQLDPNHEDHVSVVGEHFKFYCKHEAYEGNMNEKWSLSRGTGGLEVTPLEGDELRKLDAMFGKSLKGSKPASKPAPAPKAASANAALQEANAAASDDIPF